jgi:hypothetical protein
MSVIYPTINSKGICCFRKTEHGAVAGVILFFTCGAAALGPLAMGAIFDVLGGPKYGFILPRVSQACFLLACYSTGSSILPAIFFRGLATPSTTSFPSKDLALRHRSESDPHNP